MISKNLARRLERLEESLLPVLEEPLVIHISFFVITPVGTLRHSGRSLVVHKSAGRGSTGLRNGLKRSRTSRATHRKPTGQTREITWLLEMVRTPWAAVIFQRTCRSSRPSKMVVACGPSSRTPQTRRIIASSPRGARTVPAMKRLRSGFRQRIGIPVCRRYKRPAASNCRFRSAARVAAPRAPK
jgi:hypothetical protein